MDGSTAKRNEYKCDDSDTKMDGSTAKSNKYNKWENDNGYQWNGNQNTNKQTI